MTDPADLGAVEARRLIARRQLSPVELVEACIARVEAVNHAVNALVAHDFDRLRAEARTAEAAVMEGRALGPLHGLPVAIKDMNDVAGLPTTYGSEAFAGNVPSHDDALVAAIRAAGGLILGKTNVPEWSAGANTRNRVYGVTANPHDVTRSAAGSSGGSAVALATGMAPLATGSDLGGSLRNPAAFCGVTGFRPSPGVVPGPGREMALLPLSTDGPMARTPGDAALLLSVLARPDARDPWSRGGALPAALPAVDLSALRVAATEDFGFAPTEAIVRAAFRDRVERLAPHLGPLAERAPDSTGADRIFSVLRAVGFLGHHRDLLARHPGLVGPNVRANVEEGQAYAAADVAEAIAAQGVYHRAWAAFFDEVDILLCPAVCISPRPWTELYPAEIDGVPTRSYYHWLGCAYATTLAGHPSVSIPCGRDGAGLPFGLQVVGRRHDDARVLAVARELSAVIAADEAMRLPPPDLAALRAAAPLSEAEGFRAL
ncbi:amidase [Rhodovulum sp. 12E13]|uniref:amidase n=1 Tax=Rhodovulum sp. 12E13 TaxID=2203891 RepID=UPI000E15B01E|nr:amidase family protein [Rhodovulum sp. 12E13]RDC70955.1 amidase [Rhodovulum sp. 12E13]